MAKRRKARQQEVSDFGPPERANHDDLALDEGIRRARVVTQRPIDRYKSRGLITPDQHQAAERFRNDFDFVIGQPRVTPSYNQPVDGQLTPAPAEAHCRAMERYREANRAMGYIIAPLIRHVVCLDLEAADWLHARGYNGRSGSDFLRAGCDILMVEYGVGTKSG
jgi:hypothetical protein